MPAEAVGKSSAVALDRTAQATSGWSMCGVNTLDGSRFQR
jgi:hypothetical protein